MPSSALGRLQLLSSDGITDRQSFPLLHSTVTFGRAQSCDIRLQLPSVSKQHCELRIHENRTAKIHVFSVNGVRAGLSVWRRGEIGHLENGDSFVIAGKTFRMELGTIDLASEVQTPARTAPLRYSMIAAANVNTPSREAPMSQQPRRSWVASLVSPFGFGPAPSQHQSVHQHMEDLISLMDPEPLPQRGPHEHPSAYQNDLDYLHNEHDEDDPLNAPDIVPVPILPGSYFDNNSSNESISDVKGDESSDEEIENLLTSPRSSPDSAADSLASRRSQSAPALTDNRSPIREPSPPSTPPAPLPTPTRLPNGLSRRLSLREKVLIKSATKTHHVMARSHSTGHMPIAGPSTPPTPAPRRSSLPSETAVAHEQLPIPELTLTVSNFEAEEEQDMPVEAEEEPAPVEEAPVETKELSPRAIRAARRRSGSFEPPVAEEVAAPVELELEVRVQVKEEPLALEAHEEEVEAVEYDSSNDSSDSDTSLYTDRIIPLAGEPPLTPRPMLKPRKSALKTPPPPGSDTPESTHPAEATRSLKRKVSWHETNFYREIPHREDLPEVKRARMEEELAAAERAAALATPPVTRRTSLIFVHENPGQEATRAVSPIPSTTPKRTPTTPRTPHTASRAQGGAPAASVQRAFESTAAPSITTGTPRKTPLRKPGRSVSPVKRTVELPNFVPTDLEACTPQMDLAQLLQSPMPRLGSFSPSKPLMPNEPMPRATPKTAPTAQSLLARLESMRKPAASAYSDALLIPVTPAPTLPPPAASMPAPHGLITPNLAGVRQLFKPAPAPAETPCFGGVRQLFHIPSVSVFSPDLDGIKELMRMPSPDKQAAVQVEEAAILPVEVKVTKKVIEVKAAEPKSSALPVRAGRAKLDAPTKASAAKRTTRKPAPTIAADVPEPSTSSSSATTSPRTARQRAPSVSKAKGPSATATSKLPSRKARVSDKENTSPIEDQAATMGNKVSVEPPTTRSGRVLRSRKL